MTLRAPRTLAAALAVPALLAGGVAVAAPGADAATSEPTYKGSAMALSVKVGLAGSSLLDEVLPGLVSYPPGGKETLLELPEELSELVALKVLNASSAVNEGVLESNAHTASLGVLGEVITARVLNADCTSNQGDTSGDSQVVGLSIAGTKIPVDPGPNLKIEIPDALAALVQGSIVIDEQVPTGDGGIQIRALHINLVVAPTAIEEALNSVIASVRETAEQLKAVVEETTGKSLDELVAGVEKRTAKASADQGKAAKQKNAQTSKKGAQSADEAEFRAPAAAPAAPTTAEAPAEAAAPAEGTQKADGADLEAQAAAEEQDEAAATEATEAAESGAGAEDNDSAEELAAAQRAEKDAKSAAAAEDTEAAAAESTDPALAPEQAQPAAEAQPAAPAPVPVPAPAKAEKNAAPSDRPVLEKVQAAIPTVDPIAGALGLDIIVSQVTCEGAPGVAEVKGVDELPDTGGNGDAVRDVAVAGLGLLLVGGAAIGITRRRRLTV